jgi:hypothetical protein
MNNIYTVTYDIANTHIIVLREILHSQSQKYADPNQQIGIANELREISKSYDKRY